MPRRPAPSSACEARNARRASSFAFVVALGLVACGCSFPVEDFSEDPGDALSVDGPPLGDPRPDAAGVDASTSTGNKDDDHSGHDHGKKKGESR